MRLEYLADEFDGPILRLSDFTEAEAKQLFATITRLASAAADRVEVHLLPFVDAVGGCRLVFVRRSWDQAIVQVGPLAFECGLTPESWENVAGLIEPFAEDADGFQWLAGPPGDAAVLLSASGQW